MYNHLGAHKFYSPQNLDINFSEQKVTTQNMLSRKKHKTRAQPAPTPSSISNNSPCNKKQRTAQQKDEQALLYDAAKLIQRKWRRIFKYRLTRHVVEDFMNFGPTISHVLSIRY